jgi:hypothetical protein
VLLDNELSVCDESAFGDTLAEFSLAFDTHSITVREIISERVRDEVDRINANPCNAMDVEHLLVKYGKELDAEQAIKQALDAFEQNEFFVLLDNTQTNDPDHIVDVRETDKVSFVKLTRLVGG